MIYLDNAATSWPKPDSVPRAMAAFLREWAANPGRGGHSMSIEAGRKVLAVREKLATFFGVRESDRVVFTLNATHALNLAILGYLREGDHVITSDMEHNAVSRPLTKLRQERAVEITIVPGAASGCVDPEDIRRALKKNTRLVVLTHACNVTGTINPIKEVGRLLRELDIAFLVDAAQTAGHIPIDVNEMCIDMLAFPGHKGLLGPPGTGGLYIRKGLDVAPLMEGGTGTHSEEERQPTAYPERHEAGTVNSVGIVGLGAGLDFLTEKGLEKISAVETELAARLIRGLRSIEGVSVHLADSPRVCTASFNLDGIEPQEVAYILDQAYSIAVRAGLHCAPWVHAAMGNAGRGSVRVSPGYFTSLEEIDDFLAALQEIADERTR
ncbi:MAG: aminotransferase class V-fold PLP-dependent enzyme [Bacillota bacterium]